MKKYKLELIVFISGAVVMILELTGSRVLAPYLGTSTFVWTSLIGIILGSLSLGYWLGGKVADEKASYENFSLILMIAGVLIGLSTIGKEIILQFIQNTTTSIRIGSIIASIIIFGPASIFLGMVSPYAIRLKIKSIEKSGRTVGNLYAISTIGSIVGTFLAGFYLISYFGHTTLLLMLAIIMILISLLAHFRQFGLFKILLGGLIIAYLVSTQVQAENFEENGVLDTDTPYSRVIIKKGTEANTNREVITMSIGKTNSSAMYTDGDDLVYEYTKFYDLAAHFNPDFKKALMIGGGAYSYPKYFLKKFPDATIDVVEIDPGLAELSKKYFQLKEDPRLQIFHEDGRTFLNKPADKYDVIFGDAFSAFYSIPHQLTTKEAVQKMFDSLNEDGVVLINVISAVEDEKGEFLRAEYRTFKEIFPQVYIFMVNYPEQPKFNQNNMLVALKSEKSASFENDDPILNQYLNHLYKKAIPLDMPILTDEFAPVDKYTMKLF